MAHTFNKVGVERFLKELKDLKGLTKVNIRYEFVPINNCNRHDDKIQQESRFESNSGSITFFFYEKDGFDKWVEVFLNAGNEIEKQETILAHWLSIPDEFEFLRRNI